VPLYAAIVYVFLMRISSTWGTDCISCDPPNLTSAAA